MFDDKTLLSPNDDERMLLELAAKAAGIDKSQFEIDGRIDGYDVNGEPIILKGWNPLTDDGDALRLAVKLHLLESSWLGDMSKEADPYAATRRAIVRAAAEIGESM